MITPVQYHLNKFPPNNIDWEKLVPLLSKANTALAQYDTLLRAIPDPDILLAPLTIREAVSSSKIEGTNITAEEVFKIEVGVDDDMNESILDDAEEIRNYREALKFAAGLVRDKTMISQHLLRETHELLMKGVRGRNKNPGTFRKKQNWIGTKGGKIEQADFIPISQVQLSSGLERWLDYVQNSKVLDPLVQLAIMHVEFEALHPFDDGNGRLGRMIIPLFLYQRRIMSSPNFFISGYLEAHRDTYIETMRAVSRDGAWTGWCVFFLQGLIEQAIENLSKAQSILDLQQKMLPDVTALIHSQYVPNAVDFLVCNPIFDSSHFVRESKIPYQTAQHILRTLRADGTLLLLRKGAGRKPAVYLFHALFEIISSP